MNSYAKYQKSQKIESTATAIAAGVCVFLAAALTWRLGYYTGQLDEGTDKWAARCVPTKIAAGSTMHVSKVDEPPVTLVER